MEALKLDGLALETWGIRWQKIYWKQDEVVVFNRNRDKEKELIELGATSAASTQELTNLRCGDNYVIQWWSC
jgi:3-hydroxyisobutyrate dehydrogenase